VALAYKNGILLTGLSHLNGIARTGLVGISGRNVFDEYVQDFNAYTSGVSLATLPGWTIFGGTWKVSATGTVYSDAAGTWQTARYEPPGFVVSPNHEAEHTTAGPLGGGTHLAVAAAVQSDGSGYVVNTDGGTSVYLGRIEPGGASFADYVSVETSGVGPGTKFRIKVTGTGASRRVTGSYSLASGGGWVTPSGWADKDFGVGKRYDGGTCGLFGYHNVRNQESTDLTVRTLPNDAAPSFDPATITGLQGWWKADAIVGLADNDPISTWEDSHTTNRDFTSTTTKRPLYKLATVNGLPVVQFNGTTHTMSATITTVQTRTIFAVLRKRTASAAQTDVALALVNLNCAFFTNTGFFPTGWIFYNPATAIGGTVTNFNVLTLRVASLTSAFCCLNGLAGTAFDPSNTYATGPSLFIGGVDATPLNPMNVDIAEILNYETALSTTDRQAVEDYLGAKYGITITH